MRRKIIQVEDLDLIVDKRKNYKNLSLKIRPPFGQVYITSPEFVTDREIKSFVKINIEEIRKTIEKFRDKYRIKKKEYVEGEKFIVFSKEYKLTIKEGKDCARFFEDKIILSLKDVSDFKKRKKLVDRLLRMSLKNKTSFYLRKYAKIMGLNYNDFFIKMMRSKWDKVRIIV